MSAGTFSGLKFRSVGPAFMSGRVGDFAVNPARPAEYYVAVCSGGVWKTVNAGISYQPVFDAEGSYSIGCVTLDPSDPSTVWVGTGENNSQRSVSFGDGVYKSTDAGKSWKNVGLKDSQHIGMIAVDPRDSNIVYVAAQGPLWNEGGERGLYKTTDGGETWERVLHISDDTGANEVHLDPRNPDTIYVSTYQRRRHVWTLINGGPESGIHKSTDAGKTWTEINSGLPSEDKGRIGLDISPANPDVLYAIVEAANGESGFYRSNNRGGSWTKQSGHATSSPQYYNEITCDPVDVDKIYSLDTYLNVTHDAGKTFSRVPRKDRHVDDHALWIDPADTQHMLIGCDGGIYHTWDSGDNWQFHNNLPITQFYRVSVDESEPFYNIYGGTQDNNSQGGPSRTTRREGIANEDWYVTVGGDGYETVIDPTDPMIVYAQWQHGGLIRFDRRSGEILDIRPQEEPGESPHVYNWDSPLIMSPHSNTRLYFACDKLFRTDNRGVSWTAISGDLTRDLDRNQLEIMGVIQKPDAVSKNRSTSIYGNAVSLDESPLVEGLIYVGSDDGLISITEDAGSNWRTVRAEDVPGVPELAYISNLTASVHNADVVFASFDNKKMGDFSPYLFRSDNRGESWNSISGDLPEKNICYTLRQDHVNPDLLFIGTEYAVYFSINAGENWIKLSGVPTIAVRDLEIQRRESDLVLGTFGRGFYVLDDYSPLRTLSESMLDNESLLFPVKDAPLYIEHSRPGGRDGRGSMGATYFTAPNPDFGAIFTYYLNEKITTRKEQRHEAEKEEGWEYPTIEQFRAEDAQQDPAVILTVRDSTGEIIRRVEGAREKGFHRIAWDLRYPIAEPITLSDRKVPYWADVPRGPMVAPGNYSVTVDLQQDGSVQRLAGPEQFRVYPLNRNTFPIEDHNAAVAFRLKVHDLQRAVSGAQKVISEADTRIKYLRKALTETPAAEPAYIATLDSIRLRLAAIKSDMNGDPTLGKRYEPAPRSISERVTRLIDGLMYVTSPPTGTQNTEYTYAAQAFEAALADLRTLVQTDLPAIERTLESLGAPWTPGRFPEWSAR
jgi:hypothetical protein